HIFFRCNYARSIWAQTRTDHLFPLNSLDKDSWFNWLKKQLASKKSFNTHLPWAVHLPFLLWYIWNFRNGILFQENKPPPPPKTILVKWEPPATNFYKLNIDGSCEGNPGVGGVGGVFRDSRGQWTLGFNMRICH
ncbi:hypothetical protein A4A49_65562, partial [Nicotiana attenuata]